MKQYCRYCDDLVVGDGNWCHHFEVHVSDASAKSINHCKHFKFNEMDAFDITKRYSPRVPKKTVCDGQERMEL